MNKFIKENITEQIITAIRHKWKIFLLSLVAQFIVSALLSLGVRAPSMLSFLAFPTTSVEGSVLTNPLPDGVDVLQIIRPKLEEKINNFQLKKERSFIPSAWAAGEYEQATAYGVIDLQNGEVLAEKNLDQSLPIASLTKIMTSVVALDLASPEEEFEVSYKASLKIPTKIGVVPGEKMRVEELLHATMLTSANDAAQVLREGVDHKYSQNIFVKAMNEKAKILGLKNTHFQNPQGFDSPENYSSVEDLTILAYYALENYPLIKEIVAKDYHYLPADGNHKLFDLYNWNGLIGVYPGASGVKIGNTDDAGYTTVVTAERDGKKLLVVVLGTPGVLERDLWASQLLDLGFEKANIESASITEADLQAKYATWRYFN